MLNPTRKHKSLMENLSHHVDLMFIKPASQHKITYYTKFVHQEPLLKSIKFIISLLNMLSIYIYVIWYIHICYT